MLGFRLVLLALATGPGLAAAQLASTWCGEFDYKGFANRSALNITLASTATISMVWDRKARGCSHCCAESEADLAVTRSASRITFAGNGTAAAYYSFEAVLGAGMGTMEGNITNGGHTYGTFRAQAHGCPQVVPCTPAPGPPPRPRPPGPRPPGPRPPGPPPPHAPAPVWPLPQKLECIPAARAPTRLLSSSVAVKLSGPGAASAVAVRAASRYQDILRGAGGAGGAVHEITVEVGMACDLGPATNYSYSLAYGSSAVVTSSAASPFAVGYAMETLLQLATPAAQHDCGGGFSVLDAPMYAARANVRVSAVRARGHARCPRAAVPHPSLHTTPSPPNPH